MSCPQLLAYLYIGKRQVAGSSGDPVASDDHCAVVQRCIMLKYVHDKLTAYFRIDHNTGSLDIIQTLLTLYDHKCSGFYLAHIKGCFYQCVYGILRELLFHLIISKQRRNKTDISSSELLQCFSELRLEQDDGSSNGNDDTVLVDPKDNIKVQYCGYQVKYKQHSNTLH